MDSSVKEVVLLASELIVATKKVRHTIAAKWFTTRVQKDVTVSEAADCRCSWRSRIRGLFPQRASTFFPSFAAQTNLKRTGEVQIAPAHRESFIHPGTRIVKKEKNGAVSNATGSTHINLVQDQAKLLRFQVGRLDMGGTLGWQSQHASILVSVRWVMQQQVLDETPEHCKSTIASRDSVTVLSFQVPQEIEYVLAGDIG